MSNNALLEKGNRTNDGIHHDSTTKAECHDDTILSWQSAVCLATEIGLPYVFVQEIGALQQLILRDRGTVRFDT